MDVENLPTIVKWILGLFYVVVVIICLVTMPLLWIAVALAVITAKRS